MSRFVELFLAYLVIASAWYIGSVETSCEHSLVASEFVMRTLFSVGMVSSPEPNPNHVPLYLAIALFAPPMTVAFAYGVHRGVACCLDLVSDRIHELDEQRNVVMWVKGNLRPSTVQEDIDREQRFREYAETFGRPYPGGDKWIS